MSEKFLQEHFLLNWPLAQVHPSPVWPVTSACNLMKLFSLARPGRTAVTLSAVTLSACSLSLPPLSSSSPWSPVSSSAAPDVERGPWKHQVIHGERWKLEQTAGLFVILIWEPQGNSRPHRLCICLN